MRARRAAGSQVDPYFERIWERVPAGARPVEFELRRSFLLSQTPAGARVLDVGCGEGAFTAALAAAGCSATGIEVAREPLRRARLRFPELDFRLAPAEGEWDVIWAGELLEHVQDCEALLTQLRSLLRPGGRLVISTPDHPRRLRAAMALRASTFEAHFDPRHDHLRFFTQRTLRALVEDAGFERVEVRARRGVLLLSSCRPGPPESPPAT